MSNYDPYGNGKYDPNQHVRFRGTENKAASRRRMWVVIACVATFTLIAGLIASFSADLAATERSGGNGSTFGSDDEPGLHFGDENDGNGSAPGGGNGSFNGDGGFGSDDGLTDEFGNPDGDKKGNDQDGDSGNGGFGNGEDPFGDGGNDGSDDNDGGLDGDMGDGFGGGNGNGNPGEGLYDEDLEDLFNEFFGEGGGFGDDDIFGGGNDFGWGDIFGDGQNPYQGGGIPEPNMDNI